MKPKQREWEKEFDERYSVFDGGQKIIKHVTYSSWVKAFIQSLLNQQKQDILHKVEVNLATHIPTEPTKEDIQKFYNSIQYLRKDSK